MRITPKFSSCQINLGSKERSNRYKRFDFLIISVVFCLELMQAGHRPFREDDSKISLPVRGVIGQPYICDLTAIEIKYEVNWRHTSENTDVVNSASVNNQAIPADYRQ